MRVLRVRHKLYLCDLPADYTEDQLRDLLQPHGAVTVIEAEPPHEGVDLRRATVTLKSGTPLRALLDWLNRQCIGAQPLVATPAVPPKRFGETGKRTRRRSKKIGMWLNETNTGPIGSIVGIMHICGLRFTLRMYKQALEIEAGGGLMVPDGSRRRTPGGVFFYCVRLYLTPPMKEYLFDFRKRRKEKAAQSAAEKAAPEAEAQSAEASVPAAEPAPAPEPAAPLVEDPFAPPPADPLEAARERLAALRDQHAAAQTQLDAARSGQAPATGVFSLMKQVVDVQKAIDALLAEYPVLKG